MKKLGIIGAMSVEVETLKEEQQAAVEDKNVALTITAELICSETKKEIAKEEAGGFGGGKVTVAVAVAPLLTTAETGCLVMHTRIPRVTVFVVTVLP